MESIKNRIKEGMKIRGLKQVDIVEKTGINKGALSSYITGRYEPKQTNIYLIAKALNVNEAWLMGHDVPMERTSSNYIDENNSDIITNLYPIKKKKFPLIGTIACGEPILADQNFEGYVEAGADIHADFCIKAKGDSMKNIRIEDGDIIFIREQPDVENGEIAAVLIGEEATLKRVNKNTPGFLFLMPENSEYEPIVINLNDNSENIRILGKAVAFQSDIK